MGLASRGGTPLQDLALRRIPGAPGQNLDPGLNPGEFASFTSSPPHESDDYQRWPSLASSVSRVSGSSVDMQYKGACVVSRLGKPNYINSDIFAASSNS